MSHDCNIICLDCFNKRYNLEFQQMSSICINKMFRETKYILYLQFVCFPVHYWKLETLSKYLECKIATSSQTHNWEINFNWIKLILGWKGWWCKSCDALVFVESVSQFELHWWSNISAILLCTQYIAAPPFHPEWKVKFNI